MDEAACKWHAMAFAELPCRRARESGFAIVQVNICCGFLFVEEEFCLTKAEKEIKYPERQK